MRQAKDVIRHERPWAEIRVAMNIVGEFAWAVDRPESGQGGEPCEGGTRCSQHLDRIRLLPTSRPNSPTVSAMEQKTGVNAPTG